MYESAKKFGDEQFLLKLAYLCDIFVNGLNLQLQGRDKPLHDPTETWGKRLDQGNTSPFENMSEFARLNDCDVTTVIPCLKQHISSLNGFFKKYFPGDSSQYDWVRDPLSATAPAEFSSAEEDHLIDMSSDSTDTE